MRPLSAGTIYRSPSGRLCRMQPYKGDVLTFVYLRQDGKASREGGFCLSVHNAWTLARFVGVRL